MKRTQVIINGYNVDLVTHYIDGEESEVYASFQGQEIEFAYDTEEMLEKLAHNGMLQLF